MPRQVHSGDIEKALHIILGSSAAGSLWHAKPKQIATLGDPLFPGPCDRDAKLHVKKRKRFWNDIQATLYDWPSKRKSKPASRKDNGWTPIVSASALGRRIAKYPADAKIVLWNMPSWHERLSLWWCLDTLNNLGIDWNRCLLQEMVFPDQAPLSVNEYRSLGMFHPTEFASKLQSLSPLKASVARAGIALWRHFTSASPLAFDRVRRRGSKAFSDLAQVAERYRVYFPRMLEDDHSQLRLSEYDQTLFENFDSTRWFADFELLNRRKEKADFFLEDGDQVFCHRIHQWAKYPKADPAFATRAVPGARNRHTSVEFRLSACGERLRDKGLRSVDEAPAIFVGGCKLFSSDRIWVRRIRGDEWWIEELR